MTRVYLVLTLALQAHRTKCAEAAASLCSDKESRNESS